MIKLKGASKAVAVAASLILASSFVTGCSQSPGSGPTAGGSPGASATGLAPVELTWYYPGTPQKDVSKVEDALNAYLKDKINATIKLNAIDFGVYSDKTSVMIGAGDDFDIMFTASWLGYGQNVAKGAFLDITDLLKQYCPNTMAALNPNFITGSQIDGKNYGLPTQKELAHNYGLLYRKDLADKYGIDMSTVKSWEDLEPIFAKIKQADPDVYPLAASYKTESYLQTLMNLDPVGDSTTPGKLLPDGSTTVINEYATPEAKAYMELYHKWYLEGYINPNAATDKDEDADRKAGNFFTMITTLKPLVNEDYNASYGFDWAQQDITAPYVTGNDAMGSMQAISRTSKNPERALMFLELVNTDPYVNNLINFGVEGTHYVKTADNTIDYAPGLDSSTSGYAPNEGWVFGNQFINYIFKGQNPGKWQQYKDYNANATPSVIMGFQLDTEPIQTELAACANVIAQYVPTLNVGADDVDTVLPQFLQALKDAGVDKVIAEKQKQIDAWLASK